jgi:hypothetical protein
MTDFALSKVQEIWALRKCRTHGETRPYWRGLVAAQEGRCAYSGVELRFDVASSVGTKAAKGPHPLYASPTTATQPSEGSHHALVCAGLHDIVVRLPVAVVLELPWLPSWKKLISAWQAQAKRDPKNRAAFQALIRTEPRPPKK